MDHIILSQGDPIVDSSTRIIWLQFHDFWYRTQSIKDSFGIKDSESVCKISLRYTGDVDVNLENVV